MVFSSTIFLFFFLPLTLLAYFVVGPRGRNLILLCASLFFYAWGETVYLLVMLFSIAANYLFGRLIDHARQRGRRGWLAFACAVATNLGLLGFFKYANFLVDNLNPVLPMLGLAPMDIGRVHLPIGISFFTFQALSYIIDLYRNETTVQKNLLNFALYKALFPQLIAGPIVRYRDVARQIEQRTVSLHDFASGVQRFIIGLGKKVLIANVMGRAADYLFSLPPETLPATLAWTGAVAFMLQIYFDFSGYSDMAIGLGRMFGFHFLENFNYPYIARSIREFWRRWHISLSTWFRDYLYIPLGGNRHGAARTGANLLLVFLLCGLWHGASWTFLIWGVYHGFFLVLERVPVVRWLLDRLPASLQHLYVLLVVLVGWVFFRADTFLHALGYLRAMVDFSRPGLFNTQIFLTLNNEFYVTLFLAVIGSAPLGRILKRTGDLLPVPSLPAGNSAAVVVAACGHIGFLGFILVYSVAALMGGEHNPFLYFRF
ncbi:MAG: MBOAT family O-acyltransferase [Desulfobulbus sp.]|jgi:alginate O-acetyltransferase complex protein AlgI|nr:MBOAT family O-acyltransferase [Desulfobulbus sp.]